MKAIITFQTIDGNTADPMTIKGKDLDTSEIADGNCIVYENHGSARRGIATFNNVQSIQLKGKPTRPAQIGQSATDNLLARAVEHLARISDTLYLANEAETISSTPVAIDIYDTDEYKTLDEQLRLLQNKIEKVFTLDAEQRAQHYLPGDNQRGLLNGISMALALLSDVPTITVEPGQNSYGQWPAQAAQMPQPAPKPMQSPATMPLPTGGAEAYAEAPKAPSITDKRLEKKRNGTNSETPSEDQSVD